MRSGRLAAAIGAVRRKRHSRVQMASWRGARFMIGSLSFARILAWSEPGPVQVPGGEEFAAGPEISADDDCRLALSRPRYEVEGRVVNDRPGVLRAKVFAGVQSAERRSPLDGQEFLGRPRVEVVPPGWAAHCVGPDQMPFEKTAAVSGGRWDRYAKSSEIDAESEASLPAGGDVGG